MAFVSAGKLLCKKLLSTALHQFGRTGVLDFAQNWIVLRAVPYLLDERFLPNRAVPRKFRGVKVRALCNPHSPFHRALYWFGRLDEHQIDAFLRTALRSGDHFVDVGANFGQMSALAAALVGEAGSVTAFEPHPELARLVQEHLCAEVGHIVKVYAKALGENREQVTLRVREDALGHSNIGRYEGAENAIAEGFTRAFEVEQVTGDEALATLPAFGSVVVKIDVEGREPAVLIGLRELLRTRIDAVILEVTPEWIGGTIGVQKMFDQMGELAFEAWSMDLRVQAPLWSRCQASDVVHQANILFAKRTFLTNRGLLTRADRGSTAGGAVSANRIKIRA